MLKLTLPILLSKEKKILFFGGVRGLNLEPYIYYVLFLPTELSSRRKKINTLPNEIWTILFGPQLVQSELATCIN